MMMILYCLNDPFHHAPTNQPNTNQLSTKNPEAGMLRKKRVKIQIKSQTHQLGSNLPYRRKQSTELNEILDIIS
jgi:hypothetical protein